MVSQTFEPLGQPTATQLILKEPIQHKQQLANWRSGTSSIHDDRACSTRLEILEVTGTITRAPALRRTPKQQEVRKGWLLIQENETNQSCLNVTTCSEIERRFEASLDICVIRAASELKHGMHGRV